MISHFDLPLPPSVNNLYMTIGKRRITAPHYVAWREEAGWELLMHRKNVIDVRGRYHLRLAVPSSCRGDIDNRLKAVSDLLVFHNVIDDDKFADSVSVRRVGTAIPDGRCRVSITPSFFINTNTGARAPRSAGVGAPAPLSSRTARGTSRKSKDKSDG